MIQSPLTHLLIINKANQPLFFKNYNTEIQDDLNIQLHCYACLDFLQQKLSVRESEYLGQVYTIFNMSGKYLIYAYYTVTGIKILAIFQNKLNINDEYVKSFFLQIYKLYKKQLYQPLENCLEENKFNPNIHSQIDKSAMTASFK